MVNTLSKEQNLKMFDKEISIKKSDNEDDVRHFILSTTRVVWEEQP